MIESMYKADDLILLLRLKRKVRPADDLLLISWVVLMADNYKILSPTFTLSYHDMTFTNTIKSLYRKVTLWNVRG